MLHGRPLLSMATIVFFNDGMGLKLHCILSIWACAKSRALKVVSRPLPKKHSGQTVFFASLFVVLLIDMTKPIQWTATLKTPGRFELNKRRLSELSSWLSGIYTVRRLDECWQYLRFFSLLHRTAWWAKLARICTWNWIAMASQRSRVAKSKTYSQNKSVYVQVHPSNWKLWTSSATFSATVLHVQLIALMTFVTLAIGCNFAFSRANQQ